jgi:hypothetical protein
MKAPHDLQETQRWLLGLVMQPVEPPQHGERVAPGANAAANEASVRVLAGRLGAVERVAIYQRGYTARLVECLEDDFKVVAHALGASVFEALCRQFVAGHPPLSSSLNGYGARFPAYCATRSEPWSRAVSELAQLEWAEVEAIHACAEQVLEHDDLVHIEPSAWAELRLKPSPTLQLLQLSYPVLGYWRAVMGEESPEFPSVEAPNEVAVCRRGTRIYRVPLEAGLSDILRNLCAGQPLLAALSGPEQEPDAEEDEGHSSTRPNPEAVLEAFRDWVACGFFSSLE